MFGRPQEIANWAAAHILAFITEEEMWVVHVRSSETMNSEIFVAADFLHWSPIDPEWRLMFPLNCTVQVSVELIRSANILCSGTNDRPPESQQEKINL